MLYKNCLQKRYNFWVNFNYENCCGYIWTMEKKKNQDGNGCLTCVCYVRAR